MLFLKYFFIVFFLIVFIKFSKGQSIANIKTEKDCLKFINKNIEGYDRFFFDKIFTKEDLKRINLPFKKWGKLDFNNDGKLDLFFIGKYDKQDYGFHSCLYMSNGEKYQTVSLFRFLDEFNSPIILPKTIGNQKLLLVYGFSINDSGLQDSLVAKRCKLYPKGIRSIDTLVFKHNTIINYKKIKSNIDFDSISFYFNYSQACPTDSFTIYKSKVLKYNYLWCGKIEDAKSLILQDEKYNGIKRLIDEIDLTNTNLDYTTSGTDNHYAKIKIFNAGKFISIKDYGMESTFTLKAIYELIRSLNPLFLQ